MSTAKDRFIAVLVLQLGVLDSKWSLVDFVSIVNAALADTGTRIVGEQVDVTVSTSTSKFLADLKKAVTEFEKLEREAEKYEIPDA